jgi:hypothetical protein
MNRVIGDRVIGDRVSIADRSTSPIADRSIADVIPR